MSHSKLFSKLSVRILNVKHERSLIAKKNIIASFIIKALNILIGLILMPLTIGYLNPTRYGIWITLSSIVGWFSFFDIGLGNGLRNRFAEALASNDHKLAKTYVSTTYAILSVVISVIIVVFYIINYFLSWEIILNTKGDPSLGNELSILAIIVFTFFCLNFILRLIGTILIADQKSAKASIFDLIGNIISVLLIILLINYAKSSLLLFGVILSSVPVCVLIVANLWYFNGYYKIYKPSIKYVDFKKVKDLFNLGIKFFVIQIIGVFMFQVNNIIILKLFSATDVTIYNVAFKYFSVLSMVFYIIISPFWSAFTEAWIKRDVVWIKSIVNKLIKVWIILSLVGLLMLLLSARIYSVWIGNKFIIPFSLSFLVLIWTIFNMYNGIFSQLFNGLGKIKIQLYFGVISAIINIPMALYLGNQIGVNGILVANIVVVLFPIVVYPIQYYKLVNGSAHGLWNE